MEYEGCCLFLLCESVDGAWDFVRCVELNSGPVLRTVNLNPYIIRKPNCSAVYAFDDDPFYDEDGGEAPFSDFLGTLNEPDFLEDHFDLFVCNFYVAILPLNHHLLLESDGYASLQRFCTAKHIQTLALTTTDAKLVTCPAHLKAIEYRDRAITLAGLEICFSLLVKCDMLDDEDFDNLLKHIAPPILPITHIVPCDSITILLNNIHISPIADFGFDEDENEANRGEEDYAEGGMSIEEEIAKLGGWK